MSSGKYKVYGIGNAIMDLQISALDEDLKKLGLEKGSMQLFERNEQAKLIEYFHEKPVNQTSGGSAANTMITITGLGGSGVYGCLLGDDRFGVSYQEEMSSLGVKLYTAPLAGQCTGTSVILITPDAERTMNTHLGASANFAAEHVDEHILKQSEWLYIEGYLFSSEPGREAVKRAVSAARKEGVKVALTFSAAFIVECFGDLLREVTSQADLVFANLIEAQKYTSCENEDEVFDRLCESVPNVVLTMGAQGARVCVDGERANISAVPTTIVDATGAGDTFAGAFLFGITEQLSGADAGRLASFMASKVVSQLGPRLTGDLHGLALSEGLLSE